MDLLEFKKRFELKEVVEKSNSAPSNPVVSVCVQTYQHVDYIKECLDSILMQKTNFEFEILLGEDASIDGTREICKEYAEKYPEKIRLFLHHRENNIAIGGSPTGRFILMTNLFSSKGKYIALCEGDDYWTDPFKLQKQVDFLENDNNKEFVLCFHDVSVFDEKKRQIIKVMNNGKNDLSKLDLIIKPYLHLSSILFINFEEVLQRVRQAKVYNGDTVLYNALGHYGKGKYINSIKPNIYRLHDGGVWSGINKSKKAKNAFLTYSYLLKSSSATYSKSLKHRKLQKRVMYTLALYQERNYKGFFVNFLNVFFESFYLCEFKNIGYLIKKIL